MLDYDSYKTFKSNGQPYFMHYQYLQHCFMHEIEKGKFLEICEQGWSCKEKVEDVVQILDRLSHNLEIKKIISVNSGGSIFATSPEMDVAIVVYSYGIHNNVYLSAVADNHEYIARFIGELQSKLSIPQKKIDSQTDMVFWSSGDYGPEPRIRRLMMPKWEEISRNYMWDEDDRLKTLLTADRPYGSGRIILFHGPPGTGKSYAIRSMAREWFEWCETHYIIDPEKMFGSANYMTEVISKGSLTAPKKSNTGNYKYDLNSGNPVKDVEDEEDSYDEQTSMENKARWKLMVIEDADEYIREDAKDRSSHGAFSRLLNLADGILGQGSNTLILVTTNEPIEKIHKAVQRPGRAMANIHFGSFSVDDSNRWLQDAGSSARVSSPKTLAELFEIRNENQVISTKEKTKKVGFV